MEWKRAFELIDGSHYKFWTCEYSGCFYLATFGRIGTAGQTQVKTFGHASQAREKARSMIDEKLAKGYVEVDRDRHPGASKALVDSLGAKMAAPAAPVKAKTSAPASFDGTRRAISLE